MREKSSIKQCEVCKIGFRVYAYSLRNGNGKFCSQKCSGISQRGKILSDEHKNKLSEGAKTKGFGKWMKGKKLSKEWCENISKVVTGRKHTLDARNKMSLIRIGIKLSKETKKRISESRTGEKNWNYGKKFSEQHRKRISEANKLWE